MKANVSLLDKARSAYQPKLPRVLTQSDLQLVEEPGVAGAVAEKIRTLFPHSSGMELVRVAAGKGNLTSAPLTVGVVFSGGQAPGGHNVIAGLLDALKAANPESRLIGFLGGPIGMVKNKWKEITPELVDEYRNMGGFDLIGSGRDKIEKADDLAACRKTLEALKASAVLIIGGDDSNTNAAMLAEYFLKENAGIQVIGAPKTIDGDMKNQFIETSFGFDTAAKVFSELVGSICRDAESACKYWHFVRLMGRAASHVALEVALQTHPNLTIISEEVAAKNMTLKQVVDQIVDAVCRRAAAGKNYGVVVIPEGLLEFLSDVNGMIGELSTILGDKEKETYLKSLPDQSERFQFLNNEFTPHAAQVYGSLPESIQDVLLLRDKHGNVPLSQVETEKLLIDLVGDRLRYLTERGEFKGKFSPLAHFFGYEGRCVQPSNFDADYCYALGYTAAQLIRGGKTGYTVSARNLAAGSTEWVMGGVPVTSMLTIEMRKGKPKPVIRKALVELSGMPFQTFAEARDSWVEGDDYEFPGPIQYWGPAEVCDALAKTLELEHGKK